MQEQEAPNELLKHAREKKEVSQSELAEAIGAPDRKTIQRWEHGDVPQPHYRKRLVEFFGKRDARELGFPPEEELPFWYVPYRRNVCFTEREDILRQLHATFLAQRAGSAVQRPLALSGLGGVGKSQIAAEYAYRCRHRSYEDSLPVHTVLWLQASTQSSLNTDVTAIAQILDLPRKNEANIKQLVGAFKTWLTELTRWLLIFDDIGDFDLLKDILPDETQGRVLLTTHSQATGTFAEGIPVEPLHTDAGAALLLHRAKLLPIELTLEQAMPADVTVARSLSEEMEGLPLALDQAGAYVEETDVSLLEYLQLYQQKRSFFLGRRGTVTSKYGEHPQAVATTFELSLQKAAEQHPLAVNIIRFCSFLRPDAIPEEVLRQEKDLGTETTTFREGIAALQRYSLVRRQTQEQTLSMHRLVQAVVSDSMDADLSKQWRVRVMRTLNAAFPEGDFHEWMQCGRLLPHVLVCATWAEHELPETVEVAQLLCKAGVYLRERGQYTEAEPLLLQALSICEVHAGDEGTETAKVLDALTNLYSPIPRVLGAGP